MIARIIANGSPIFLEHTDISFSTKLHGGYETATVRAKLNSRLNSSRIETIYFQRLIITNNSAEILFDGRIMSVNLGKGFIEISASGWGISATMDKIYLSTSVVDTDISVIMAEVLGATYCPDLSTTQFIQTNTNNAVRFSNHAEYPFEVATRLCALSDTNNSMWSFGVWNDKIPFYYDVYNSVFRRDWVLKDTDNLVISYNTSAEELRNSVRVVYLDEANAQQTTAFSTDVQTGHPTRELEASITRSSSAAQANRARVKMRNQLKRPQSSINLRVAGTIHRKFGARFPVEYVKAGDFIDISGIKMVAENNTIDLKNVLVASTYWENGVLTITPGA